jgi:hypothetical protein
VSTLLGLEMSYRLDPAAVDEPMVVAALRRLVGAPVRTPVGVPTSVPLEP